MEERIPAGAVWQCMIERGMNEEKLQKEWKKKSCYLIGKAELMRREYKAAVLHLEVALKLIAGDAAREKEEVELKTLLATANKKKTEEVKKEKNTWSKAFEKNKSETDASTSVAGDSAASRPSTGTEHDGTNLNRNTLGIGKERFSRDSGSPDSSGSSTSWDDSLVGVASVSVLVGLLGLGAYYFFKRR